LSASSQHRSGGAFLVAAADKKLARLLARFWHPQEAHPSRPLKKTHILRCARSSRYNVLAKYASARRFFARLGSEIFLSSLQSGFFINLLGCLRDKTGPLDPVPGHQDGWIARSGNFFAIAASQIHLHPIIVKIFEILLGLL
jgi:hypothetical protein